MEYKPHVGRPLALTQELYDKIIEAVPLALRTNTVANYCKIAPASLRRWLKQGMEDAEEGNISLFAQFWLDFNHKKAEKIIQWLGDVEQRLPNWQAVWELVKVCGKEDFGLEAVEYKELLDLYNKLVESYKRFTENPLQGVVNNGREMDIKGD